MVFDLGDAGGGPGGADGFVVFGFGADGAFEVGQAVGGVDFDVGGVDEGGAFDGVFDGGAGVGEGDGIAVGTTTFSVTLITAGEFAVFSPMSWMV